MATLVLSAAGMALGGAVGGSVMGLTTAVIGRAVGAAIGRSIDQQLLGSGSVPVAHGRIDRFRLSGASEGTAIKQVHGRMRIGGQIIWASRFQEHSTTTGGGGGKGAPRRQARTHYTYSVSVAVALCAGEITRVGRVWADGVELSRDSYTMRVYRGTSDQQPDPKIEAIEGTGNVPAYRGLAYVLLEDLDVTQFGNRVPQLTFEVHRPGQPGDQSPSDLSALLNGVAMIPGTGEYALATEPVTMKRAFAEEEVVNVNTPSGETDFQTSFTALQEELPRCEAVSLVVSWFGSDLRCNHCTIRPRVEQTKADGETMPWSVAGITRAHAGQVPQDQGRPIYGGTPCDASVIQAIKHMRGAGKHVMFYPFILMDQIAGNQLPDPWSDAQSQPVLPWRGRITTSKAPGQPGSPDGTAAARDQVTQFFDGPNGYRRFILHYAHLCAQAGGVDAFCIGSEMKALTFIRDDQGYPAVDRLIALAAELRPILGADCKISYAADWSEYHGHQPGGGDKIFHLDPLWADQNIDFIGIDNYMPLSDWRDGEDHADAHWGAIYNLDYLKSNVAGGEMYDWYYHSPEARAAQIRTPITDGAGEPWIWRQKDLRNWWENPHHNRIGGVRSAVPTAWVPGMKPIWFTEYGCAAIDKGTNQPNKFLDPKSSESSLPRYSSGRRDDFMMLQYIRAIHAHYSDPDVNPVHPITGHKMVDMTKAHIWSWDARPWPAFPAQDNIWSDGANYAKGHWINGRASSRPLSAVVREICDQAGVQRVNTQQLWGLVRGYSYDDTDTARAALQPLMLAYGFDVIEKEGALHFRTRNGRAKANVDLDHLALGEDGSASPQYTRAGEAEVNGRVRITYVASDEAYEARSAEAVLPDETSSAVAGQELPLVLTSAEAQAIAEGWLAQSRVARDQVRFALPPSMRNVGAGDVVTLGSAHWRVDRVEASGKRLIEATRVDPALYVPADAQDVPSRKTHRASVTPLTALFMDLPIMRGTEQPHAPHVAMTARPWPGVGMLMTASGDADYHLLDSFTAPATMGETLTDLPRAAPGLWDKGPALRVRLAQGELSAVAPEKLLYGANLAAIGSGDQDNWELIQFAGADLVAPRTYDLRFRLRGQAGTDGVMPDLWPVGSKFVLMTSAVRQIHLPPSMRGVAQDYRWGPGTRPQGDTTWRHATIASNGIGLRPYSVCHLRGRKTGGDHAFRWIRRSRVDGDNWSGFDVPLGEDHELYAVTVIADGGVKRSLTVTRPEWTYDAASRSQDGVSGRYSVSVSQVSARFGAGPAKSLTMV